MDFEATIDAKKLKHAITVLHRLNMAETVFNINADGVMCRLMDKLGSQLTQVKISSDAFDIFSDGSVRRIGVDLAKMASVMKRATAKDTIHVTGAEDALHFTRGIHQRSISLLDPEKLRNPKLPELQHTINMTLSGTEFKEIIAEAADVSEVLYINIDPSEIQEWVFEAQSDHTHPDTYRSVMGRGRLQAYAVGGTAALYDLKYLYDIATDMTVSDEISWKFSDDMPCEISYSRDGVEIVQILAPRIETT